MPNPRDRILEFRILSLRDPDAFGEFYQTCKADIYRFVLARTTSEEIAEDLTSEVFLKACQYLFEEQRAVEHLRGLLFSIARTSVIDHFRRTTVREEVVAPDDPFFENLVDHAPSATDTVDTKLAWGTLMEQLKMLRREYREALALRFMDDLSIEEISVVLGKSTGSVRVLIHRATRALEQAVRQKNIKPNS